MAVGVNQTDLDFAANETDPASTIPAMETEPNESRVVAIPERNEASEIAVASKIATRVEPDVPAALESAVLIERAPDLPAPAPVAMTFKRSVMAVDAAAKAASIASDLAFLTMPEVPDSEPGVDA